ncbi:MAG: phosphoribosylanthranilate isomerase [Candidimonas sp.]
MKPMKAVTEWIAPRRTRVKICGLTRIEDVRAAVGAGADAIGLVFFPESRRCVSLEHAGLLRRAAPAFVSVVALFVNASRDQIEQVIEKVRPDLLQFHGDETPDYCRSFGRRYMRAFRVGAPGLETGEDLARACRSYSDASAWLFDSYSEGYGGSGRRFDVGSLDALRSQDDVRPIVLAGGMTSENVAQSIARCRPYAVDVSSGVEDAPGVKSASKIRAFMNAVAEASG